MNGEKRKNRKDNKYMWGSFIWWGVNRATRPLLATVGFLSRMRGFWENDRPFIPRLRFFSSVNFVCWLLFSVYPPHPHKHTNTTCVTAVADSSHSAESANGRLHINTHTPPWSNEVGVGWLCRCPGIVWEPLRKRVNTQLIRERSATVISVTLTQSLWSDPGQKSGISMRELNLKKTKKQVQAGNEWSNILPKSSQGRKKPPPLSITPLSTLACVYTYVCPHTHTHTLSHKHVMYTHMHTLSPTHSLTHARAHNSITNKCLVDPQNSGYCTGQ